MEKKVDVSIIVPVYNAQKTLERCIESVLRQTYENYELLLVDDGSTDASGKICDKYAQADSRVRVIHKENTGVSDTRNMAIECAEGEYIQFIDSDDWIIPEATALLYHAAADNGCELVISDFYRVINERVSQKGNIEEEGILTREAFAAYMMDKPADFYYGVLWNKLFRRDIIEKFHLRMDKEISWCEDFMFNLEYIRHISRAYVLKIPTYYYVRTKGSLASQGASISKTIKMKMMVFEYYKKFYQDVFGEEDYEKSRMQVYRFLFDAAGDGIVPPAILPGSFKLGQERTHVDENIIEEDGILMDAYRERKLLEKCLEIAALRNDLTLEEAYLLLCVSNFCRVYDRRALSDATGLAKGKVFVALHKLALRNFIEWKELAGAHTQGDNADMGTLEIRILPEAQTVMEDLALVQEEYEQIRFAGFEEEEIRQYMEYERRIKENTRNVLLKFSL